MTFRKSIFLFIIPLVGLFSCQKDQYKDLDFGYDFFGIEEGRFVEYSVRYIEHDSLLNQHDTLDFFYKTLIGEKYIDNEGREAHEFLRYKKDSLHQEYQFINKWVILIANDQAQLVEENQRKIKMIFPVKKSQKWNSNAYNSLADQEAHYEHLNELVDLGLEQPRHSVTVEFERYTTLIDDRLEQEVYAKGIGMVTKISKDLYYQFGASQPFKGIEWYYNFHATGIQ